MRPTYENSTSLKTEKFFLYLHPEYVKVPKKYGFDFMRKDGLGIAELKNRNYTRDEVPDGLLFLSLDKYTSMLSYKWYLDLWENEAKIYFLLNDGLFYALIGEVEIDGIGRPVVGFGGRTDRGDWQDQEPLVYFNVKDLKIDKTKEEIVEAWERFKANESINSV